MTAAGGRLATWTMAALGVTAVVAGLVVLGSPADARRQRIDEHRVSDLQRLSSAIDVQWNRTGQLPENAAAIGTPNGPALPRQDPATGAGYEYHVIAAAQYELCATFDAASEDAPGFWSHGPGRMCFTVTPQRVAR